MHPNLIGFNDQERSLVWTIAAEIIEREQQSGKPIVGLYEYFRGAVGRHLKRSDMYCAMIAGKIWHAIEASVHARRRNIVVLKRYSKLINEEGGANAPPVRLCRVYKALRGGKV